MNSDDSSDSGCEYLEDIEYELIEFDNLRQAIDKLKEINDDDELKSHTNYYSDVENEALSKWNNKKYPIENYFYSIKWYSHIIKFLDIPYEESKIEYLKKYMEWQMLNLSDEWFYKQ